MSYDDEDDYEPATPTVAVAATLILNTPALDLNAQVGRQTLADLICREALHKLAKGTHWDSLKERVQNVTEEEIRTHVTALLADALNGDLRRTNKYGEPHGEPATLRTLIAEEAKKVLTQITDNYRGPRETVIGKLVREEVERALKAELLETIAAERTRVVAAVRGQAAKLIAESLAAGIGQKP